MLIYVRVLPLLNSTVEFFLAFSKQRQVGTFSFVPFRLTNHHESRHFVDVGVTEDVTVPEASCYVKTPFCYVTK